MTKDARPRAEAEASAKALRRSVVMTEPESALPRVAQRLLYLQRTAGNNAVCRLVRRASQARLQRQVDEWQATSSDVGSEWSAGPGAAGSQWTAGPDADAAADSGTDSEAFLGLKRPWVDEEEFSPGGPPQYLNYEGGTDSLETGWQKDVMSTAALAAAGGVVTSWVLAAFIPEAVLVEEFLSKVVAPMGSAAVAMWRSYKGFAVQRRVSGEFVPMHEWYGKYRYNLITREIEAVRFRGRGPTQLFFTTGLQLEQRLTDAQGNELYRAAPISATRVRSVIGKDPIYVGGVDLANQRNLPEWDFGDM